MSDGFVVVDKPGGWTSHDVVARVRQVLGTRRVGHAGTLDPMATGVLVVGVGRATRLLGFLRDLDKAYDATIRLGQVTRTDDADGEVLATVTAGHLAEHDIRAHVDALTGEIEQIPPAVSALKVRGRRAYARSRAGEEVELPRRRVTVGTFEVVAVRRHDELVDLDVVVACTSGTYVRALARDLGASLRVGGHLTALRRTRVGPFTAAVSLDDLAERSELRPPADVVRAVLPARVVAEEEAVAVSHGRPLPLGVGPGPVAIFGPDDRFLAVYEDRDHAARALAVFAG